MDAYWKYQAEKEKKLYAVIEAFAQNNGHLGVTDARYVNALKLFIPGVTPLEYYAHRGFAHVGRQFAGAGPRVACQMQAVDELRHFQTEIHAIATTTSTSMACTTSATGSTACGTCRCRRASSRTRFTAGPFEFLTAISFSFEYVLTNLLFVPFMSGAAYNGDMATVTFGFSAQSDESRHMTLGIECIKFMLEQDPANVPIVQRWIDKWFWRGYRLLTLVAMMQDYMLPKRVMSWKEAWEMYVEHNGGALFNDLARYGIRTPKGWAETPARARSTSATRPGRPSTSTPPPPDFHTWCPSEEEMEWLSEKYPDTFDQYYRPRSSTGASCTRRASAGTTVPADAVPGVPDADDLHRARRSDADLLSREQLPRQEVPLLLGRLQARSSTTSPRSTSRPGCRCTRSTRATASTRGIDPTVAGLRPAGAVLEYYDFGPRRQHATSTARRMKPTG